MSFSSEIKQSLCEVPFDCKMCISAELAGIISFSGQFNADRLKLVTEKKFTAERMIQDIKKCTGKDLKVEGSRTIRIETDDSEVILQLRKSLKLSEDDFEDTFFCNECCTRAFIRGAFIGSGCVSNPKKNYHLEFTAKYRISVERLLFAFECCGISPKVTYRKGNYLVYLKESQNIADALGLMGANMGALEFYSVQMEKEVRNTINRQINCEVANQEKISVAANRQLAAIKKIRAKSDINKLTEVLQEMIRVREAYPEVSLKDLGQLLNPPIGKSGVNHRLNRIVELAEELK